MSLFGYHQIPGLTEQKNGGPAQNDKVVRKTLLRWLREPQFYAAYREARRLAYGQSIARLQQAASAAASTLLKIMIDPSSPPSCRLRAADSVMSHAAKAIEIEDIEARVSDLERAADKAVAGK